MLMPYALINRQRRRDMNTMLKADEGRYRHMTPRTQQEAGLGFTPWESRSAPYRSWCRLALLWSAWGVGLAVAAGFVWGATK